MISGKNAKPTNFANSDQRTIDGDLREPDETEIRKTDRPTVIDIK